MRQQLRILNRNAPWDLNQAIEHDPGMVAHAALAEGAAAVVVTDLTLREPMGRSVLQRIGLWNAALNYHTGGVVRGLVRLRADKVNMGDGARPEWIATVPEDRVQEDPRLAQAVQALHPRVEDFASALHLEGVPIPYASYACLAHPRAVVGPMVRLARRMKKRYRIDLVGVLAYWPYLLGERALPDHMAGVLPPEAAADLQPCYRSLFRQLLDAGIDAAWMDWAPDWEPLGIELVEARP